MRSFYLILLCGLSLIPLRPGIAQDKREQANSDLDAVIGQVEALQRELQAQQKSRSQAARELARAEKGEQAARSELRSIRERQRQISARQAELGQQAAEQERRLAEHRARLGEQLRVSYINGREEWLRMSLSQQDPAQLGRQQVLYGYLSRARARLVAAVSAELEQLAATRAEIDAAAREAAALEAGAAARLDDIATTRREREQALAAIAQDLSKTGAELERLQAQEQKLRELVVALDKMLAEMAVPDAEPFAGQTDRLTWPAEGRLLHRYGQPRADGRLKWQGVLIGAPKGANVSAVYHGRVVFADWLDGMGLLMIVEHGDGYMSLYGHNQALLKDVGQAVQPGDVIAEVGDSGGQAAAGLYFEIRKNGSAVNPESWIK